MLEYLIMMGILKFQTIHIHWETHRLLSSGLIQGAMSRDKFKYINRILKLGNASDNNKLTIIRMCSEIICQHL